MSATGRLLFLDREPVSLSTGAWALDSSRALDCRYEGLEVPGSGRGCESGSEFVSRRRSIPPWLRPLTTVDEPSFNVGIDCESDRAPEQGRDYGTDKLET